MNDMKKVTIVGCTKTALLFLSRRTAHTEPFTLCTMSSTPIMLKTEASVKSVFTSVLQVSSRKLVIGWETSLVHEHVLVEGTQKNQSKERLRGDEP